ncbi:hypothetical protein JZ751_005844 [Albula glossodonta]|uniref:Uncharacterized protein n=1 Tax=Albula glossodonta TaxID=121402 RepID=A0A8T2PDU7_9TELE|nr:hypothetical protein JZ751_005844 [Albula glossodonta]
MNPLEVQWFSLCWSSTQDCRIDVSSCVSCSAEDWDYGIDVSVFPVHASVQRICSVSCGQGKRARYVSCRDSQGGVADESYCAHLPRPPESSECFSPCGQWRTGDWSPCSETCGVGRSTRQVMCSNYHQQVEEGFCDPDERPSTGQECSSAPCPSVYHLRPNDQPTVSHADYPRRPSNHPGHNSWNVPSADHQWRTGPWGACSSTCAGGFQRRVVVCQDTEGRATNHCQEQVKPAESKNCDSGPCPHWNYGIWGEVRNQGLFSQTC